MSILKTEDARKWINAFVVLICFLIAYVAITFFGQLSEWFDLEAKIKHYIFVQQSVGILFGVIAAVISFKNKKMMKYLNEVYAELVKVVWPEKDTVLKVTVGIVIGVSIVSGIFVAIDYVARKVLSLLY
jgi:preprotein translocase subunit SecE